jgi:ABC-type cobalamin/Fe3+-siderophores transport system ATPase subunit
MYAYHPPLIAFDKSNAPVLTITVGFVSRVVASTMFKVSPTEEQWWRQRGRGMLHTMTSVEGMCFTAVAAAHVPFRAVYRHYVHAHAQHRCEWAARRRLESLLSARPQEAIEEGGGGEGVANRAVHGMKPWLVPIASDLAIKPSLRVPSTDPACGTLAFVELQARNVFAETPKGWIDYAATVDYMERFGCGQDLTVDLASTTLLCLSMLIEMHILLVIARVIPGDPTISEPIVRPSDAHAHFAGLASKVPSLPVLVQELLRAVNDPASLAELDARFAQFRLTLPPLSQNVTLSDALDILAGYRGLSKRLLVPGWRLARAVGVVPTYLKELRRRPVYSDVWRLATMSGRRADRLIEVLKHATPFSRLPIVFANSVRPFVELPVDLGASLLLYSCLDIARNVWTVHLRADPTLVLQRAASTQTAAADTSTVAALRREIVRATALTMSESALHLFKDYWITRTTAKITKRVGLKRALTAVTSSRPTSVVLRELEKSPEAGSDVKSTLWDFNVIVNQVGEIFRALWLPMHRQHHDPRPLATQYATLLTSAVLNYFVCCPIECVDSTVARDVSSIQTLSGTRSVRAGTTGERLLVDTGEVLADAPCRSEGLTAYGRTAAFDSDLFLPSVDEPPHATYGLAILLSAASDSSGSVDSLAAAVVCCGPLHVPTVPTHLAAFFRPTTELWCARGSELLQLSPESPRLQRCGMTFTTAAWRQEASQRCGYMRQAHLEQLESVVVVAPSSAEDRVCGQPDARLRGRAPMLAQGEQLDKLLMQGGTMAALRHAGADVALVKARCLVYERRSYEKGFRYYESLDRLRSNGASFPRQAINTMLYGVSEIDSRFASPWVAKSIMMDRDFCSSIECLVSELRWDLYPTGWVRAPNHYAELAYDTGVGNVEWAGPAIQQILHVHENKQSDRAIVTTIGDIEPSLTKAVTHTAVSVDENTTRHGAAITFEHVSFAYPSDPGRLILDDVSFHVPAGALAAIVGESGCGKSTLIALLLRVYEPTAGRVLIGGVDVRELPPRWLRRRLAYVGQACGLLPLRITENLRLGSPGASQAAQWAALERACARRVVERRPGQLEAVADASELSGGERQRLVLARALLRGASEGVLANVLDEATSALDVETERRVQQALSGSGVTTLAVAHRLFTVRAASLVVVLGPGGRVMEQGSFVELAARPGSQLAALVALQSSRDEEAASGSDDPDHSGSESERGSLQTDQENVSADDRSSTGTGDEEESEQRTASLRGETCEDTEGSDSDIGEASDADDDDVALPFVDLLAQIHRACEAQSAGEAGPRIARLQRVLRALSRTSRHA